MRGRYPQPLLILFLLVSAVAQAADAPNSVRPRYRPDEDPTYKGTGVQPMPNVNEAPLRNKPVENQADSFAQAAEHATYLQVYQELYSPYGYAQGTEHRNKMIGATALAIQDCLKGNDCSAAKQELIVKALSQYNYGQELKRMSLENSTNHAAIGSLSENNGDNQNVVDTLHHGSGQIDSRSTAAEISLSSDSDRPAFYQLDTGLVAKGEHVSMDPKEQEILGKKFVSEYKAFMVANAADSKSKGDQEVQKERRFKYIESKPNEFTYDRNQRAANADQLDSVMNEQESKNIQKIVKDHVDKLSAPTFELSKDGKTLSQTSGENGSSAGYNSRTIVNSDDVLDKNGTVLKVGTKALDANASSIEVARRVNLEFQAKHDEMAAQKAGTTRNLAAATPSSSHKTIESTTVDPNEFDKFLDDIWPTGAHRQQLSQPVQYLDDPNAPVKKPATPNSNPRTTAPPATSTS